MKCIQLKILNLFLLIISMVSAEKINVGITFTKVAENQKFQDKFKTCVTSILKHSTVDIDFYIIGDKQSQVIARDIFTKIENYNVKYQIKSLDSNDLAEKMHKLVSKMQKHFSTKASYYGDSLFFLSIGLFKVFDPEVNRIILLDADLKFQEDIGKLHDLFKIFKKENVIGIARDGQPVYRHTFWRYRNENPNTRVGAPPPNGLTGFNSGVLLLDLEKMRESKLYDSLITPEAVDRLTKKYYFQGHLGDQDFFTLIGMEHEDLFYVLPCTWNRQLCQWWRGKGYDNVFDEYYECKGKINILHGNCDTPFPPDETTDKIEL